MDEKLCPTMREACGLDWLRGFMKRHENDISLRKPENTSIYRARAFKKLEKYKYKPDEIWNLDENGLTTVMPPTRVVAPKGKKQVAHISSQERVRNPEAYLGDEYPTSSISFENKQGWMASKIEHFANHVKCAENNRVLLLIDNHESPISVEVIGLYRENGIVLLPFPPHTIHRLQPLDVGVYGPFRSYLTTAQHDWLLTNPAKVIQIRPLATLAQRAYENALTIKNITSLFKNTGLCPLNRQIFSDEDFIASKVTSQNPMFPMESSKNQMFWFTEKDERRRKQAVKANKKSVQRDLVKKDRKRNSSESSIDIVLDKSSDEEILKDMKLLCD
ncbi:hypothetical protein ILUMI_03828 [Ignelater luminosus]|uniref:DDE-1 domain-containing protein n=1 Tax=Ignelater luminosus TaxID=2038154 RepID=A0A8K0DFL4_IGNLU|nr:hypothetical protein ILUMI_03828 [Ignelater luminosus]